MPKNAFSAPLTGAPAPSQNKSPARSAGHARAALHDPVRKLKASAQAAGETPEAEPAKRRGASAPAKRAKPKARPTQPTLPLEAALPRQDRGPEEQESEAPAPEQATPEPAKTLRQELLELLKDSLSIRVEDGDFTDPNTRRVKLYLDKECISSSSFSVRSRREYEG